MTQINTSTEAVMALIGRLRGQDAIPSRDEVADCVVALLAERDGANVRAEAAEAEVAKLRAMVEFLDAETFYIDCEFDGHEGPLLSIAMVREDGRGLHVKVRNVIAEDTWVQENVVPVLDNHHADLSWHVEPNEVGTPLRGFITGCRNPTIIADSPVDIGRFCRAISTGEDGGWASSSYPRMTFIVRNVDCYPTILSGAVRHNAWWDAMALRAALKAGR